MKTPASPGPGAGPNPGQRRGIRRMALLLGLVAIAIYVGFIASGVMKAGG